MTGHGFRRNDPEDAAMPAHALLYGSGASQVLDAGSQEYNSRHDACLRRVDPQPPTAADAIDADGPATFWPS